VRPRPLAGVLALAVAAFGLGACGGTQEASGPDYRLITPPAYVGAPPVATPTPGKEPHMTARDAKRLRPVLAGWAAAVRHGQVTRATHFFSLPTIIYQASLGPVEVRSKPVADAFNRALPCGARLLRTRADGRYIVGTFVLETVKGKTCTTPKQKVRVGFVFGDPKHPRRFTEWWQVADGAGATTGPEQRPVADPATAATFGTP
jgi:hypothetical protein